MYSTRYVLDAVDVYYNLVDLYFSEYVVDVLFINLFTFLFLRSEKDKFCSLEPFNHLEIYKNYFREVYF